MTKNKELKKLDNKNQEVTKYDFSICPNCGAEEVGRFCPNCGQSNKDFNKPIKEIFGDLLDSINLDVRLLNTLIPFFTKPGFLTEEYFKGKRKRYVPPMRMYILFSVLFFFLAQFADMDDFKNIGKVDMDPVAYSTLVDAPVANQKDTTEVSDTTGDIAFNELTPENKNEIIKEFEEDTTISDGWKKVAVGSLKVTENLDVFRERFLNNISYVLFTLMPVFAFILGVTLWRSKKMYVHHLIFSINFHSFIFGFLSILIVLGMILSEKLYNYSFTALLIIPLYLMVGIKRYYNKTYIKSFFKSFGISLLYLIIIFIVLLAIFLFTAKGLYEA